MKLENEIETFRQYVESAVFHNRTFFIITNGILGGLTGAGVLPTPW